MKVTKCENRFEVFLEIATPEDADALMAEKQNATNRRRLHGGPRPLWKMKFDFWLAAAGASYAFYLGFMLWMTWRDLWPLL